MSYDSGYLPVPKGLSYIMFLPMGLGQNWRPRKSGQCRFQDMRIVCGLGSYLFC